MQTIRYRESLFGKNYSTMLVSNEVLKNIAVKSLLNLNMKIKNIAV